MTFWFKGQFRHFKAQRLISESVVVLFNRFLKISTVNILYFGKFLD